MNKKLLEEKQQDELLFEYQENRTLAMWAGLIFKWAFAIALVVAAFITCIRLQAYQSLGGTYHIQNAPTQESENDSLSLHNVDVVTNFEGPDCWTEGRYWIDGSDLVFHVGDKTYRGWVDKKDKIIHLTIDGQEETFKKEASPSGKNNKEK